MRKNHLRVCAYLSLVVRLKINAQLGRTERRKLQSTPDETMRFYDDFTGESIVKLALSRRQHGFVPVRDAISLQLLTANPALIAFGAITS